MTLIEEIDQVLANRLWPASANSARITAWNEAVNACRREVGAIEALRPRDVFELRGAIRNILYRHLPTEIGADVCRAVADEFLALALAAGAGTAETNEDLAQSEGRQSGHEVATPSPSHIPLMNKDER